MACCGWAAMLGLHRWLGYLRGTPRVLAAATLFTAAVIAVHLVPGALGLLSRGAVVAAAVALAGALTLLWRLRPRAAEPAAERPGSGAAGSPGLRALAAAVATVVAAQALAHVSASAGMPIASIDALNFQVPTVARWLQEGDLWGLHQFYPDYSNATYPHNGNLLVAAVVLPFRSAFLAPLVAVPYWVLSGVAVHALAREVGAPWPAAALAGTAFAAIPVNTLAGLEGVQTDAPMLACLIAGALFLLRHHRSGSAPELVLAGIALGLALGTKWYALSSAAVVLLLWAVARAAAGVPRARVVREGALLTGLVALAGGFWLLRNLEATGNPLFPQEVSLLGIEVLPGPPDPLRDVGGFTLADYALRPDVWWTYLRPGFTSTLGLPALALALGAAGAAVATVRRLTDRRVLLLLAGVVLLSLAYAVTPFSAFGPEGRPVLAHVNTRYALPALAAAAAATAWLAGRLGPRRPVVEVVLSLAALHGTLTVRLPVPAGRLLVAVIAVGALAAAAARLRSRLSRRGIAGVLAFGLLIGLVGAEVARRRDARFGYSPEPALSWIEANAPSGVRVGLAGMWSDAGLAPPLPAFGPRLGNDVVYLGVFREHMLRMHSDRAAFIAALRGVDLLIVGRRAPVAEQVAGDVSVTPRREEGWAREAGFVPVAESRRLALLRAARFRRGG